MSEKRYTIAVDFDGVIHSYTSGWNNEWLSDPLTLLDPPVEGAIEWLTKIQKDFEVVILTTRGQYDGCEAAINQWLLYHGYNGVKPLRVTHEKIPALMYVDDRGWRFTGDNFPSAGDVHRMRPWNKPA